MAEASPEGPGPGGRGLGAIPAVRLLRRGPFAVYTLFNCLSLIGSWGQRVAAGWLVWEWTGSGFWLGVLAAADLLPAVFVGPFAGALADRWSRLVVNRICQSVLAALAGLVAVLVFADAITLSLLIALSTLKGVFGALSQPARLALVQELVPRADVGPAVAINSVNTNLARLIGPAVAAAMILHVNIGWVFLGNAAVTLLFVFALGRLRLLPSRRERPAGHVLQQVGEGFRYVLSERPLRLALVTMLLGGVLVRSLAELLPAFAARGFADTATGLATLTSSLALGALLAGLTVGRHFSEASLMRNAAFAWALAALFGFGMGLASGPWLSMAFVCGSGFGVARGLILTQTFVQLRAPDAMRGRALSVHGLIARSSPSIGALAIGSAFDVAGLPVAVSAATIAFAVVFLALLPAILRQAAEIAAGERRRPEG
ncbi:MAG: MFS transporter [Rhodobacteraceae bacterium]|jgi:MFS family permease|nr:MFS transporter [Paracoccaceae bacterium]